MRRLLVVSLGAFLALALATPAFAATAVPGENDNLVVLSGNAVVPAGTVVDTVVVFDGTTVVSGRVTQTVVSFNGPVTITGTVAQDVVVFNGRLTVGPGANVMGDVFAENPVIDPTAQVGGAVHSVYRAWWGVQWAGLLGLMLFWLAVAVSVLLLGLILLAIAPRAADASFEAARTGIGPSIWWGLAALFGLPILSVVAMATLVGFPLGLGVMLALALVYALGQTAGAWVLGRALLREPKGRFAAFLAGWAILSGVSLIPGVGFVVWFAATVFGLGALAVAIWRARMRTAAVAVTRPVPSAPAPMPM